MSECIYGVWKRRFPVLKEKRTDFTLSQKIIVATAVLFNIGRSWGDEEPEEDLEDDDECEVERDPVIIQDGNPATIRLRGQVERDRLKDNMN